MKYLLMVFCATSLASCATNQTSTVKYSVFPVEPEWQGFTRDPIIEAIDGGSETNFIVSDELIKKTIQQTNYLDKVSDWRVMNSVP
jgi:hypothetical protein